MEAFASPWRGVQLPLGGFTLTRGPLRLQLLTTLPCVVTQPERLLRCRGLGDWQCAGVGHCNCKGDQTAGGAYCKRGWL